MKSGVHVWTAHYELQTGDKVFNKPCHPTSVHCLLIRRFFPDSPTTEPSLRLASASADFQVLLVTPSQ